MEFEIPVDYDTEITLECYPQIKNYSPTTKPDSRPIRHFGKEIGREPYNKLFVEINTLEELVNFMTELNQKIILRREDEEDMSFGHLCLEIYDDWRE